MADWTRGYPYTQAPARTVQSPPENGIVVTNNPREAVTQAWNKMVRGINANPNYALGGVGSLAKMPYVEEMKPTVGGHYVPSTGQIGVNPMYTDPYNLQATLPHEFIHKVEYMTPPATNEQERFNERRRDTINYMMNDMHGIYGSRSIPPAHMTAGEGRDIDQAETMTVAMQPYFNAHPGLMKNFLGNLKYWQTTPPPRLPIYDQSMSSISDELQLAPDGDTTSPLNNNVYRNMMWKLATNIEQINKHGSAPLRATTDATNPENYDKIYRFNYTKSEAERDKIFKFPKGRK